MPTMEPASANQPLREETRDPGVTELKNNTKPKSKIPGLEDPYDCAPPKPDGDPWAILLKPELETDKIRCDGWKEEVQTLLIFAGLFSAVVTAFVIESYKFLQPDPNDTIINLLTQIANGPNITASLPSSTKGSTLTDSSFAQNPSSIRLNVFWFISLILSLTTVLIGTIALQWLREHQAYPDLSPKQSLAILRMRSESLEAWYVPHIFAALPLLLQAALVLFLAGLIDFTAPLGVNLSVPIACIIGLVLLFLAATTVIPSFQALSLLSGQIPRNKVPSPCAYKSPQSQVFRTLSGFLLNSLSSVFPKLHPLYSPKNLTDFSNIPTANHHYLFPHVYDIWHRKSWSIHDLQWLSLRDAYHNRIVDKDDDLYDHRTWWEDTFPLSDITQCLVKIVTEPSGAKHTEEFLVAACHCFQELAESVWKPIHRNMVSFIGVDRRNHYFEHLYRPIHKSSMMSVSRFLLHGSAYNFNQLDGFTLQYYVDQHRVLFYEDQTFLFRAGLLSKHRSAVLQKYHAEVGLRIMQYLLEEKFHRLKDPGHLHNEITASAPTVFDVPNLCRDYFVKNVTDLLATLVENVATCSTKKGRFINPLYTHGRMLGVLKFFSLEIISYLQSSQTKASCSSDQFELDKIGAEYGSIFHLAAKYLDDEIARPETSYDPPSILFYHVAVILKGALSGCCTMTRIPAGAYKRMDETSDFSKGLIDLLDALTRYKNQKGGRRNEMIENQWANIKERNHTLDWGMTMFFSEKWWVSLFYDYCISYDLEVDPDTISVLESDDIPTLDCSPYSPPRMLAAIESNLGPPQSSQPIQRFLTQIQTRIPNVPRAFASRFHSHRHTDQLSIDLPRLDSPSHAPPESLTIGSSLGALATTSMSGSSLV